MSEHALSFSYHSQRSTELQRQAVQARLSTAVREGRRARRLAERAARHAERSRHLAQPRLARS